VSGYGRVSARLHAGFVSAHRGPRPTACPLHAVSVDAATRYPVVVRTHCTGFELRNGMNRTSTSTEASPPARPDRQRRTWLLLLLAGGLPLLALVAATVVGERRTTALLGESVRVFEPTRATVSELRYRLSLQMGDLRGYALTGSDAYLDLYWQNRTAEAELWPELHRLARSLSPEVATDVRELDQATTAWHRAVEPPRRQPAATEVTAQDIDLQTALFDEVLRRADALDEELGREQTERLRAVERLEDVLGIFTLAVSFVVLVTSFVSALLLVRTQRLAQEAERRRRDVVRLADARNRLLRGLSHDVKNPLSAAIGYTELLRERWSTRANAEENEWLKRVHDTVSSASGLLDDLVTFARADVGQLDLSLEALDVTAAAREVARSEEGGFDAAGVTLEIDLPDRMPPVHANRRALEQILTNLLSNARKYTPSGGRATVRAETRHDGGAPGPGEWLALQVSDSGPGIPPEERGRIFEEYTRLEPERAPGTGLGLAISRALARSINGDVSLDAASTPGSTFVLWLPIRPSR
jgi:signal transduction histidine kinase